MGTNYKTTPPPTFIDRRAVSSVLDAKHLATFQQAIENILSTPIAEETFAQLVDGLPLADVAFGNRGHNWTIFDPVDKHEKLCPEVMERLQSIRGEFDLNELPVDNRVLQQYQNVPDGSSASKLPLMELVAVTIHVMAIVVYQQNMGYHEASTLTGDVPSDYPPRQRPVLSPFALCEYSDPSQYPDGVKELPGYWAEDRIFGGVVLFERGVNGDEVTEIWFHSHRRDVTGRIYALTYKQKLDFYNFLQSRPDKPTPCPLPILGDASNRERVDAEIAIPRHNIYRDRWERKIKRRDYNDYLRRRRDVVTSLDYPELDDDNEDD